MAQANVKVKIVNACDEALARRGLLPIGQVRSQEVFAIVDNGTMTSVVSPEIAKGLGLEILRQERATSANGSGELVGVAELVAFEILDRRCCEEPFVFGHEVLIGQIPLNRMDLVIDCESQQVTPNPKHPDGPMFRF